MESADPTHATEPDRPSWWGVAGVVLVGTLASLAAITLMLLVSLTLAIGAATWDLATDLPDTDDEAQVEAWLDDLGHELVDHAATIVAAALVPLLVTWVAAGSLYKLVVRLIWGWRIGWLWAMTATAAGWAAGVLGYTVDAMLLGASLGMVGTLVTTAVTASLLRLRMQPPRVPAGAAPLPPASPVA